MDKIDFLSLQIQKYSLDMRERLSLSLSLSLSFSLSLFLSLSFAQTILQEKGRVLETGIRNSHAMFPPSVGASDFFTTDSPLPGLAMP